MAVDGMLRDCNVRADAPEYRRPSPHDDHLLMNRPRDPGVIWSKSTQAAVGVLVGCIAAAGIQLVAKPAAPEQTVEAPKVSVVMVAEMDPGPSATLEATASPSPTGTPLPSPAKQAPAIEQAASTATLPP